MAGQARVSGVDVEADGFLEDMERWYSDFRVDGEAGALRLAIDVQNRARQLCPVDTGRLRSSIHFEEGQDAEGYFIDVGTDVEYAAPVEFGTWKMRAQPYLRPAFAEASGGDFPLRRSA